MTDFSLDRIVHESRAVSAGYHLMMGRGWRIIGEEEQLHSPLAYAAFELRCSIERTIIELFVLVKDKKPSRADIQAMNSIARTIKAMYRAVGGKIRFRRAVTFNRILCQVGGVPRQYWLSEFDVDLLLRHWSTLSEYCHRQLKPNETWDSLGKKWLLEGYVRLNEVETYLWSITVESHVGWVQRSEQQPEARDAYDEFLNGQMSERALTTRLQLMSPVLAQRMKARR